MANAMELNKMNGTERMDTGETSQGAQELNQKGYAKYDEWCSAKNC